MPEQVFDSSLIDPSVLVAPSALVRHTLPVVGALEPLFPDGGMVRGTTVAVDATGGDGATSLALTMVAAASQAGSWVAVVGMGELGLGALKACGVDPGRVLLVDRVPAADWPRVVSALAAGVDVLVVAAPGRSGRPSGQSGGSRSGGSRSGGLASGVGRRLATLARERGTVVVTMHWEIAGFEPGVRLEVVGSQWDGLDSGHGHLRRRQMTVERSGRGSAARRRRYWLWLPGADGEVCAADAVDERRCDGDSPDASSRAVDAPVAGVPVAGVSVAGAPVAGAKVLPWPGRGR
jgi:hypothetical protein